MKTLYLIRHGEPEFPEGRKLCLGRMDLPLSHVGWQQAKALASWFDGKNVGKIYTSLSLRSRQTAGCLRVDAEPVPGLEEIDMGAWDGLSFAEIRSRFPPCYEARGRDIVHVPPPKGESFSDCLARVHPIFDRLVLDTPGDFAVVAHSGINRTMLCVWSGMNLDRVLQISQPYGCINVIQFSDGGANVVSVAEIPTYLQNNEDLSGGNDDQAK